MIQTQLQHYLMTDLLGIETDFRLLVPKINNHVTEHTKLITWGAVFAALDLTGQPPFIQHWVERYPETAIS